MKELTLEYIITSCQGEAIGEGNYAIDKIITDSRQMIDNKTLFIALKGEKYDGHNFVSKVLDKGASAVIISNVSGIDFKRYKNKVFIVVEDTLIALQKIAAKYRQDFKLPVVAITGSVGKTTTKEILSCGLKNAFNILYTEGNFNNDIGLPLTILRLMEYHEIAVVELAMRAQGEISRLVEISRPTCAIITNVEAVHLETLGSIENIAAAKCEVLAKLSAHEFAFINGDNELLLQTASAYPCHKYTFGYNQNCDCRIMAVATNQNSMVIKAELFGEEATINFPLPAPKLAINVVAAVGMALKLGVPILDIINNLANYKPAANRLIISSLPAGGIIINDTYNANPLSMEAALETGRQLKGAKKLVAVLGDMFELGEYEIEGHQKVGELALKNEVDTLITVGTRAKYIAQGAIAAGMSEASVCHFANKDEALAYLKNKMHKTEVILFKASRGMELETLIKDWLEEA